MRHRPGLEFVLAGRAGVGATQVVMLQARCEPGIDADLLGTSRLGVPRRLAVALPTLGCVLALLAPNQASASSLTARHETQAGTRSRAPRATLRGRFTLPWRPAAGPTCARPPTVYPSWSSSSSR